MAKLARKIISCTISNIANADPDTPAFTVDEQTISRPKFDLSTSQLARAYQQFNSRNKYNVSAGQLAE